MLTTTPPPTGTVPPARPLAPPRGTTVSPASSQTRITAAVSSVEAGETAASGNADCQVPS